MMRLQVIVLVAILTVASILIGLTLVKNYARKKPSTGIGTIGLESLESALTYLTYSLYESTLRLNLTLLHVYNVILPNVERAIAMKNLAEAESLLAKLRERINTCENIIHSFNETYLRLRAKLPPRTRAAIHELINMLLQLYLRKLSALQKEYSELLHQVEALSSRKIVSTKLTAYANVSTAYPGQHVLIRGCLCDIHGHPLAGQRIHVYMFTRHWYITTSSDGSFNFTIRIPVNVTHRVITVMLVYIPSESSNYSGSIATVKLHILPIPVVIRVRRVSGVLCPGGWVSFRLYIKPNTTIIEPRGTLLILSGKHILYRSIVRTSLLNINVSLPHTKKLSRSMLIVFNPSIAALARETLRVNLTHLYKRCLKPRLTVSYSSIVLYPFQTEITVNLGLEDYSRYSINLTYGDLRHTYTYVGPGQARITLPVSLSPLQLYAVREAVLNVTEYRMCVAPTTHIMHIHIINLALVLVVLLPIAVIATYIYHKRRARFITALRAQEMYEVYSERDVPHVLERTAKVLGVRVSRSFTVRQLASVLISKLPSIRSVIISLVYVYEQVRFGVKIEKRDILRALLEMFINSVRSLLRLRR